jgi:hypothetical protein
VKFFHKYIMQKDKSKKLVLFMQYHFEEAIFCCIVMAKVDL